jgi:hypothetical protein
VSLGVWGEQGDVLKIKPRRRRGTERVADRHAAEILGEITRLVRRSLDDSNPTRQQGQSTASEFFLKSAH